MDRTIHATFDSVACDTTGTCVAVALIADVRRDSDVLRVHYPAVYARPFSLITGETGDTVLLQRPKDLTTQVLVAAVAPGVFVAVADGGFEPTTAHRIEVE